MYSVLHSSISPLSMYPVQSILHFIRRVAYLLRRLMTMGTGSHVITLEYKSNNSSIQHFCIRQIRRHSRFTPCIRRSRVPVPKPWSGEKTGMDGDVSSLRIPASQPAWAPYPTHRQLALRSSGRPATERGPPLVASTKFSNLYTFLITLVFLTVPGSCLVVQRLFLNITGRTPL